MCGDASVARNRDLVKAVSAEVSLVSFCGIASVLEAKDDTFSMKGNIGAAPVRPSFISKLAWHNYFRACLSVSKHI